MCVCIPQAATEDHGICRDTERRGHQGCGPGLSKWVRQNTHTRTQGYTHFTSIWSLTHEHILYSRWIYIHSHIRGRERERERVWERHCLTHSHSHKGYLCDVLFTVGTGSPQVTRQPCGRRAVTTRYQSVYAEHSHREDQNHTSYTVLMSQSS